VDIGRRKEIAIQNIRRQVDCVESALESMETGRIRAALMATHHFGFRDTPEAFELVADYRDGVMKAMIDFNL